MQTRDTWRGDNHIYVIGLRNADCIICDVWYDIPCRVRSEAEETIDLIETIEYYRL